MQPAGQNNPMIEFRGNADGVTPAQLEGFFEGWPDPPSPETHLRLLQQSTEVVLAVDSETMHVVGFITAVSDRVLAAYIPLLEVLTAYKGRGIGSQLVRRMVQRLEQLYMIDLVCDAALEPFYEGLGMRRMPAMVVRNQAQQSGAAPAT